MFFNCGIRNAILGNFMPLESRTDVGMLWENYLQAERRKLLLSAKSQARGYFWRTTSQQEVDYVEEAQGSLNGYEFKWNDSGKARIPLTFKKAYPDAKLKIITRSNIEDLLLGM